MRFLVFLALMGAPAMAQDIRYSDADTRRCVDSAGSHAEMESCVGTSAAACMSATDMGSTTVGMGACLSRELAFWDALLNANYQALRTRERGRDAEWGGPVNRADALRDMQRAWIAYRDRTCDYEYAQWGGGTGGGPASVGCQMTLTGHQAIYLQQIMDNY